MQAARVVASDHAARAPRTLTPAPIFRSVNPTIYGEPPADEPRVLTTINRLMMIALVLAVCAGGMIAFVPLFRQQAQISGDIARLESELKKEKAINRDLEKRKALLQNNPEYIESTARDLLNMAKPGEIIIRFEGLPPARRVP